MKTGNPIMSGETKAGTSGSSCSISVIITDPDVLKCNICTKPLFPPIFQCENGHIACSPCCINLNYKCHACSCPIGYIRSLATERILESIKFPCQKSQTGREENLGSNQIRSHQEKASSLGPFLCPISACDFSGSSLKLSLHFTEKHSSSPWPFRYNFKFSVCFDKDEPFVVLQAEEDGLLFLLNNRKERIGNLITMTSIGTKRYSSQAEFLYDLGASSGASSLSFHSFTRCVKGQLKLKLEESSSSSPEFLLVPCDFFGCSGQLKLDVLIWHSEVARMKHTHHRC